MHLICHALPIERICKSHDLVCFHLDDYIDDVRNAVLESRFRAYPILDEHEHVVGTLSRFHLLRPRRKQVILVDHNEKDVYKRQRLCSGSLVTSCPSMVMVPSST